MKLYRQSPQIRTRQLGTQTILVDIKKNDYLKAPTLLHLNSTGRCIWNLLQKPQSVQEVASAFYSGLTSDVDLSRVEKETERFIQRLWEMGYLILEEKEENANNGLQSY